VKEATLTESSNVADEGDSITYTVTTNQDITEDTTLQISAQGDDLNGNAAAATPGEDFNLGQNNVTFEAGASEGDTVTFDVNLNTDNVVEGLEGFKVSVLDDNFDAVASESEDPAVEHAKATGHTVTTEVVDHQ